MKTSQKYLNEIKAVFIDKALLIVFGLLIFGNVYSQNSNCNAKLEVINNQSSKKAGVSGVSYRLKLTNTGFDSSSYEIRLINDKASQKEKLISKNNQIEINGEFYNVSLKKMKSLKKSSVYKNRNEKSDDDDEIEIFLKGKESRTFIVKMKTPIGAKIGSKNKSKVIVTSDKCKKNIVSVVLNTEIIDGE
jgi:hypothetical protein